MATTRKSTKKIASRAGSLVGSVLSLGLKIAIGIFIVSFIYSKTIAAYEFGLRVFNEPAVAVAPGKDITVSVTEGKGYWDIANILEDKGLVRDAKLAYAQIWASEYRENMKPGSYVLNTSMTTEEMLAVMAYEEEEEE